MNSYESNVIEDPVFYRDSHIPFRPARVWSLTAKWDYEPSDNQKAIVTKEFTATAKNESSLKSFIKFKNSFSNKSHFPLLKYVAPSEPIQQLPE